MRPAPARTSCRWTRGRRAVRRPAARSARRCARATACAATGNRAAAFAVKFVADRPSAVPSSAAPSALRPRRPEPARRRRGSSQSSSRHTHFWMAVSRPSGERRVPGNGREHQMRVIDFAIRRLDDLAMARPLQRGVGRVLRGDRMDLRVQLIGAVDRARAGHRHGVVVAGAAFGRGQVVPAVALVEMRRPPPARWRCRGRCSSPGRRACFALASYSCSRMPAKDGLFGLPPTPCEKWFHNMLRNHLRRRRRGTAKGRSRSN